MSQAVRDAANMPSLEEFRKAYFSVKETYNIPAKTAPEKLAPELLLLKEQVKKTANNLRLYGNCPKIVEVNNALDKCPDPSFVKLAKEHLKQALNEYTKTSGYSR